MTKKANPRKAPQAAYTQEFRETAIRLAIAGNKSIGEVARELGLPEWKLYSWVKQWKKKNTKSTSTATTSAEEELKKALKRNKELEQEVEILKKAAAYFARTLL